MKLDLMDFAHSYLTRTGRLDDTRLRAMSPAFMARYEASKPPQQSGSKPMTPPRPDRTLEISDAVPSDSPGAREIGFALPQTYNASRILFDNLAKGHGDRLALIGPLGTRSYAELCAEACRWGHGFASLGLTRGDRILMFLDDTPAYPAALFGAVRAGFVPLLINTLTPPDLLQFYLADSGAAVAVADAELFARFDAEACKDTSLRTLIVVNGVAPDHAVADTIVAENWLPAFPAELAEADTDRNEMAFWMYSSGSTGRPKGIVHLQHDMAYSDAAFACNVLKLAPGDICFRYRKSSSPTVSAIPSPSRSRSVPRRCCCRASPRPASIFAAIERFRPSVFFGLPTLYTSLTKSRQRGGDGLFVAADGALRRRGAVRRGLPRLEGADRPGNRRRAGIDRSAAYLSQQSAGPEKARRRRPARPRL